MPMGHGGNGGAQNYHGGGAGVPVVNNGDRRHMPSLVDRRHISPPLHINICENTNGMMNINTPPAEGMQMHQRAMMDFSHGRRRHGIGEETLFNYLINQKNMLFPHFRLGLT